MQSFLKNTSLIKYDENNFERIEFQNIHEIDLSDKEDNVLWLNTYGLSFKEEIKEVGEKNKIDDFVLRMALDDQHRNKMIELSDSIFLTLKVMNFRGKEFESEQMLFIITKNYLWSLQEYVGDYFATIRQRIEAGQGIARKKKTNYLLFLIVETIIDNYVMSYNYFKENYKDIQDNQDANSTQELVSLIESNKQELFLLKKAISTLKEAILKIETASFSKEESHYFTELKEQAAYMIDDIDFDLQQLESNLNLVFNMQSDRLNQIMKTLTTFSVIFIPLTFLAGIYGMNFKYMPELDTHYGYFVLLGIMIVVAVLLFWYFKKKKWF